MPAKTLRERISSELGFTTLANSSKDVYILLLTRFIRMFAYGSSTLILALYFAALGHSDTKIGLFMTLTLIGDVGISLALTFVADSLGRRNILIMGALLMTASGVVFATFSNFWILLAAAVVGVISPSGNEIGPFRAVEESTLAHLSDAKTRSDIFAFYVIFGTMGTAGGSLVCGWATQGLQNLGWSDISSFRAIFWIYAVIGLVKAGMNMLLSKRCEAESELLPARPTVEDDNSDEEQPFITRPRANPEPPAKPQKKASAISQISPASRRTLTKLCGLFFFDSLASGMITSALIAFFMKRKFGMPEGQLGTIMSIAQFCSSFGNIFASALGKRIGLVKTMVFTHLPSAIFLMLIPLPSSLILSVIFLVLRSSLSSMDQAPRSAFLSAVVLPNERTAVMGVVNTVKTMSQSSGPLITGSLANGGHFWIAFVIGGALKVGYDLGMLSMFVGLKLEGDDGRRTRAPDQEAQDAEEDNELGQLSPTVSDDRHDREERSAR
ncbi:Hypothetical protein R9X50_00358500 [Acrodontium crateriforme]|uniref:Major facilitator superfamily (MFS) profile domain-containing protein n=1 Tax=Acrodontium crateriforme TaxID=150365 RepID=A0AAQ3M4K0_9PEZI|nr:Hypothetical protein R9X50_00358500 [Acrodontium crateriforme]